MKKGYKSIDVDVMRMIGNDERYVMTFKYEYCPLFDKIDFDDIYKKLFEKYPYLKRMDDICLVMDYK